MSRAGDYIPADVRRAVVERANHACEYCLMPDDEVLNFYTHQIDHIRPLKHRGTGDINNLAYACFYCNSGKGPDLGSIYDLTGNFAFFYNPRTDTWSDHFQMVDFSINSITATGWVTALMLQFNTPARIETRRWLF